MITLDNAILANNRPAYAHYCQWEDERISYTDEEDHGVNNDAVPSQIELEFKKRAERWKSQTRGQSSIGNIVMHPDYLEIIGFGERIIPFILEDLQKNGGHWFFALRTLARTDPVNRSDAGNIKKMKEAWLDWGRSHGKL